MNWMTIIIALLICITIMFVVMEITETIKEVEFMENEAFKEMFRHEKEDDN